MQFDRCARGRTDDDKAPAQRVIGCAAAGVSQELVRRDNPRLRGSRWPAAQPVNVRYRQGGALIEELVGMVHRACADATNVYRPRGSRNAAR